MFSTLTLFAKHNIHLTLVGLSVSPATYTSLNGVWLIILSPFLALIYKKLHSNKFINIPNKYAFGTILSGIAFISLYLVCLYTAKDGFINGNWMILYFFFASFAELLIAAIGFSLIAIYFRKEIVTLGMGFFMLALAAGGALSGKLGQLVAMPDGKVSALASLPTYMNYFIGLGIVCIVLGAIYFIFSFMMHQRAKAHGFELK